MNPGWIVLAVLVLTVLGTVTYMYADDMRRKRQAREQAQQEERTP